MSTPAQDAAADRNRLAARRKAAGYKTRAGSWVGFIPPDWRDQLYALGIDRDTGHLYAAHVAGGYEAELTALMQGREVRICATSERPDDLFPNLLRAFG